MLNTTADDLVSSLTWDSLWNLTDGDEEDGLFNSDWTRSQWFRALCASVYGLLAMGGLVVNAVFCLVIWKSRQLHSVTHLLMTNLAFCNLLFLLFHPVFFMTTYILQANWTLGTLMCKTSIAIVYLTANGSFYFMSAVAIDRWLALFRQGERLNSRGGRRLAMAVWIVSLGVASPYLYWSRQVSISSTLFNDHIPIHMTGILTERVQCAIDCTAQCKRNLQIVTIALLYCLPLLIMIPAYAHMAIFLWRRAPIGSQSKEKHRRARQKRRRMLIVLLAIVASLVICWSPLFAVSLMHSYGLISGDSLMLYIATSGIALLGIILTPSLYLLNDMQRQKLLTALPFCATVTSVQRENSLRDQRSNDADLTRGTSDEEHPVRQTSTSPMLSTYGYGYTCSNSNRDEEHPLQQTSTSPMLSTYGYTCSNSNRYRSSQPSLQGTGEAIMITCLSKAK